MRLDTHKLLTILGVWVQKSSQPSCLPQRQIG